MEEPAVKKAVAFFDGQNLYHHAKAAFGHHHPNYEPNLLFRAVCAANGWEPHSVRFYTGVPIFSKDAFWHGYWTKRLLAMRRGGIMVTHRSLRYYPNDITNEDGEIVTVETPIEKGIDVRLALDVVRLAMHNQYDVGVIFSQDQDLAEVVEDVKEISRVQDRWIKLVSAFPSGPSATASAGVNGTDWFRIDQAMYDTCLDPRDYR